MRRSRRSRPWLKKWRRCRGMSRSEGAHSSVQVEGAQWRVPHTTHSTHTHSTQHTTHSTQQTYTHTHTHTRTHTNTHTTRNTQHTTHNTHTHNAHTHTAPEHSTAAQQHSTQQAGKNTSNFDHGFETKIQKYRSFDGNVFIPYYSRGKLFLCRSPLLSGTVANKEKASPGIRN